ncbi:MAG: hypothetical protein QW794_08440 [Thermosphaera sp.]
MVHWSYDEGYAYCSRCEIVFTPYEAYFYHMRCPHCGKKIRGDERRVLSAVQEKLRAILRD